MGGGSESTGGPFNARRQPRFSGTPAPPALAITAMTYHGHTRAASASARDRLLVVFPPFSRVACPAAFGRSPSFPVRAAFSARPTASPARLVRPRARVCSDSAFGLPLFPAPPAGTMFRRQHY